MVDIGDLIQPIDADERGGRDLRLEPGDLTFQTLKEYATRVDASVAESESEAREPDWHGVVELCTSVLQKKSKDLEVAAALAQGWTQLEGVTGAARGLELVRQLVEGFWETLHPGVDPDDASISLPLRARWLLWLDAPNGFVRAVKQGPLLAGPAGVALSWQDQENSALLDDVTLSAERRAELVEKGVVSSAEWRAALAGTDGSKLRGLVESIEAALATTQALAALCADRFADDEPPDFFNLRSALDEMAEYLRGQTDEDTASDSSELPAVAAGGRSAGAHATGPISSREDALRALRQVGDYFRRAEPHSPISYLIARAVRWGSMPLDQLLRDVVRDDGVIGKIWETLGLDERHGSGGGGGADDDED